MKPVCERVPKTKMRMDGPIEAYLHGAIDQWLLVAPKANPGMLEMFRDRDASPLRQMVPWSGEFAGKYLTSAVQVLRTNEHGSLRKWIKEFVRILISFQADDGYLGPWPRNRRLTNRDALDGGTWDTWGHYHIMLGLTLWYEETRDREALGAASRIGDLLCGTYLGRRKTRLVDTGATEMNMAPVHGLCILHRKTGEARYLDLAHQLVDEFGASDNGQPLAGDYLEQALKGTEFFDTPKPRWESLHPIMALAEMYWITGEGRYRTAVEQIWWSIVKLDRHNNGGFSSGEKATGNPYHLAAIESCCTIAWSALSVEMLKLTGESVVADELELTLLNSVTGMHSSTGRWGTYDTPMNGVRRASAHSIVFQAREGTPELNCCSVNTPRGFGMLSEWAIMKDCDGLLVNYYGDSKIAVPMKRGLTVTITQRTAYPVDGKIAMRIEPSRTAEFDVKLRIPHWSSRTRVRINGKAIRGVKPCGYLSNHRTWRKGDRVEIALDMSIHIWRGGKECKGLASLYRGPVLLAYDHRYNLDIASGKTRVRDYEDWDHTTCDLKIPTLDAERLKSRMVVWDDWMPPMLLIKFRGTNGKAVRLCDFGSAGEAGTPYCSWLPVKNVPKGVQFSRDNPLRSQKA